MPLDRSKSLPRGDMFPLQNALRTWFELGLADVVPMLDAPLNATEPPPEGQDGIIRRTYYFDLLLASLQERSGKILADLPAQDPATTPSRHPAAAADKGPLHPRLPPQLGHPSGIDLEPELHALGSAKLLEFV